MPIEVPLIVEYRWRSMIRRRKNGGEPMFTQIGGAFGLLFCLYSLVFRWKVVVGKYGSLSLYWWALAVTVGWGFVGLLVDLIIWGMRYAIWWASY